MERRPEEDCLAGVLAGSIAEDSQKKSPPHNNSITDMPLSWWPGIRVELLSWLGEVGTLINCKAVWKYVFKAPKIYVLFGSAILLLRK